MTLNPRDFGLSDEYWARLSPEHRAMYGSVRPLRQACYSVSNALHTVEHTLAELDKQAQMLGGQLQLNPDFQRGHVWPQDKQIAFIENVLRGTAPFNIEVERDLDDPTGLSQTEGAEQKVSPWGTLKVRAPMNGVDGRWLIQYALTL